MNPIYLDSSRYGATTVDSSRREEVVPDAGETSGTAPDRCGHGPDWHAGDGCEARGCPCEVPA